MRGALRLAAVLAVVAAGIPGVLQLSTLAGVSASTASLTRCHACTGTSCTAGTGPKDTPVPGPLPPRTNVTPASPDDVGVPGSDTAVIYTNFAAQDADDIADWTKILEGEHFKVTEYSDAANGPGSATLANFLSAAKAGVFIISTHGADEQANGFNGLLVSEFTSQASLDAAWNADERNPSLRNGALRKINFVDNHRGKKVYSLWMTASGIQRFFADSNDRPDDQLFFVGACWSGHLASAFGATAYFGYSEPATDRQVFGDVGRLLGRLDGRRNGGRDRDTSRAWLAGGFTKTSSNELLYHPRTEAKAVALSPSVGDIAFPDGQDYALPGSAGPFKIHFDAAMDTKVDPSAFLSLKGAKLVAGSWSSPSELDVDLKDATCAGVCPVTITINSKRAVSAGKFHNWLDGDLEPAGGHAGVYPNGDDEDIPFAFAGWHEQAPADPNPDCTGLFSVAVASPADAWAVGHQGLGKCVPWGTLAEHWNGKAWTVEPSDSPAGDYDHLYAVTRAGTSDFYAVGLAQDPTTFEGSGLVEESTGGAWTTEKEYSPGYYGYLDGVSADSAKDVWAVGYGQVAQSDRDEPLVLHDSDGTWTESSPQLGTGGATQLLSAYAASPTDVWAAGWTSNSDSSTFYALLLHSTGGAFKVTKLSGTTSAAGASEISSVSGTSASDIWAVGYVDGMDPLIEHYNGTSWTEVPSHLPDSADLYSVTAVSRTDAWAIGVAYHTTGPSTQLIVHWDGTKWSRVTTPTTPNGIIYGVGSSSSGYAVAVGSVLNEDPYIEAFTPAAAGQAGRLVTERLRRRGPVSRACSSPCP